MVRTSRPHETEIAPGHAAGTADVAEGDEQRNPTLKKENHR